MAARITALFILLIWPCVIVAEMITEEKVVESVLKHHPKIEMALLKLRANEKRLTSSLGAFDTKFSIKNQSRVEGFYSGDVTETRLSQPLPFLNTEVYGGYRRSRGNFPVYEDEFVTLNDGETMAGISLSLLGDGTSNEAVTDVRKSEADVKISEQEFSMTQLLTINKAIKTYWKWVYYGQVSKAYNNLFNAAKERNYGIIKRVEGGDLPETFIFENKRILSQRESDLILAKQEFVEAANDLALYYRDDNGDIKQISDSKLPSTLIKTYAVPSPNEVLASVLETHPRIQQIRLENVKLKAELSLAQNEVLPDIDLNYEISDDSGQGSSTREAREGKVKASVSFPLQQRKAGGKIDEIKEKMNVLYLEEKWLAQQLSALLNNHYTAIRSLQQSVTRLEEAMTMAKQLFEAEGIRLANGDSDFFHLNQSEQNLIKATLDYYKSILELNVNIADYEMLILREITVSE